MPLFFGGQGVLPDLQGQTTTTISLAASEVYTIPSGWFAVKAGKYTTLQEFDPITQIWRAPGAGPTSGGVDYFHSDGFNWRLANQSGCAIGGYVTNGGSGYTSAPTVTASAGNSIWRAILGGAINTSITIQNGGTNYTYPPIVLIAAPPAGGVQATAHCTISGGVVNAITVDDQGAGYNTPPLVVFVNDPREVNNPNLTTGVGAAAITTLTGSGTITAIVCVDHGTPVTGTTLPTFVFSGGGGGGLNLAATVIMCWSITAYNVSATTAGSSYQNPIIISAYGGFSGTAAAYTNPTTQANLLKGRAAQIIGAVSGNALTTTGQVVNDGGIYPGIPTMYAYGFMPLAGGVQAVFLSPTMGGYTDVSQLYTT